MAAGGDDRQASHWRDDAFNKSENYIGIVDPTIPPGRNMSSLTLSGTYFTLADIRALDVMGYDIDGSDYAPFPTITEPVLVAPIADAVLASALDVVFSWDAGNEIEADLLVYDLGTTIGTMLGGPVLVYRQDGVVGGSVTVGAGEIGLQPGHRYQWSIGARYAMGFATSPPATFIAACQADRTGDGAVNFFDMSDFLADYDAMDPSADLAAPFGVWNFFDVNAYQALYIAGCP